MAPTSGTVMAAATRALKTPTIRFKNPRREVAGSAKKRLSFTAKLLRPHTSGHLLVYDLFVFLKHERTCLPRLLSSVLPNPEATQYQTEHDDHQPEKEVRFESGMNGLRPLYAVQTQDIGFHIGDHLLGK